MKLKKYSKKNLLKEAMKIKRELGGLKTKAASKLAIRSRGQSLMEVILQIPIVLIGLLVAFIILEPISQALFTVLDTANSAVITQISTIKLIIGLIGLILVAMAVVGIVNSFRRPRTGYEQGI